MANADVLIVNWSSGRRFLLQNDRSLVGTTCPDAASSFESSASSGKLNREGGNASASNKNRTQSFKSWVCDKNGRMPSFVLAARTHTSCIPELVVHYIHY